METLKLRPLKVGLMLPTIEGWFAGRMARWTDLLDMARLAEDVGFDSLCLPDHLLFSVAPDPTVEKRYAHEQGSSGEAPKGLWEAWTILAGLAACTRRIELGPLVSCASFRNPTLLAKIVDTVDEISGGRLILGLGAGYHEFEYSAFGYDTDHLVSRFGEALHVVHTLLRRGAIDFNGRYFRARGCELRPRGPRSGGPPILIGALAHAPRMLGLAARYADLWNAWSVNSAQSIAPLRSAVDAACVAAGRDPATLGRTVATLIDLPGHEATPRAAWVTDFRSAFAPPASGSPEQLATLLREFAGEGISHVHVVLEPMTPASIESFAGVLALLDRPVPVQPPRASPLTHGS